VSASDDARLAELRSLRQEILVRVVCQNVLLIVCWIAFGALLVAARWTSNPDLLVVYGLFAGVGSAMWAHHGCRTAQIRAHLQSAIEPEILGESRRGWEAALERMRFRSVLGSRWFVSTKGFLLGSQALVLALLVQDGGQAGNLGRFMAAAALVASTWLLFEPPLDGGASEGRVPAPRG